jgi:hypothetical protein
LVPLFKQFHFLVVLHRARGEVLQSDLDARQRIHEPLLEDRQSESRQARDAAVEREFVSRNRGGEIV